jgi:hypothetical protein
MWHRVARFVMPESRQSCVVTCCGCVGCQVAAHAARQLSVCMLPAAALQAVACEL